MSAEELLTEMARPRTSEPIRSRIRERLVEMYAGLARDIACRYRSRGEPVEDLQQVAYLGLVKAINGYDADLGHDFRGYAMVTMLGEVKRHFRDRTWALRVPRLQQERRSQLNTLVVELSQALGRSPNVAELAVQMGIDEEEVLLTMDASRAYSTFSLDSPFRTDEQDDGVILADVMGEADRSLELLVDYHAVRPLIDALPFREKHILLMRFYGNRSQSEIAAEFGISQMHVSRILRTVLRQLRAALSPGT